MKGSRKRISALALALLSSTLLVGCNQVPVSTSTPSSQVVSTSDSTVDSTSSVTSDSSIDSSVDSSIDSSSIDSSIDSSSIDSSSIDSSIESTSTDSTDSTDSSSTGGDGEDTGGDDSSHEQDTFALNFYGDNAVWGHFEIDGEEVTEAQTGDVVDVVVEVEDGYVLDSIEATGAELSEVFGAYILTVGTSDVTVTASSRMLEKHSITVLGDNVDYTLTVDGEEVTRARVGDEVTLTLSYDEKYTFGSIESDDVTLTPVEEGHTYTFEMVDADVTIEVELTGYYELSYVETPGISNVKFTKDDWSDLTTPIYGAEVGTRVLVHFTVDMDNYRLDSVFANDIELFDDPATTADEPDFIYAYTVSDEGGGVITFNLTPKHYVKIKESEKYTILNEPSDSHPVEGDPVSFRVRPNVGYRITSVTVADQEIEPDTEKGLGWYTFDAPTTDAEIVVNTEACKTAHLNFTGTGYTNLQITDAYGETVNSGDNVNVGDTFTFSFDLENGHTLNEITYGEQVLDPDEEGLYTFTATDADDPIFIGTTEKASYTISLEASDNYTYTITDNGEALGEDNKAYVGDEITLHLEIANVLAILNGVSIKSGETEVTPTSSNITNSEADITFVMPEGDITITPDVTVEEAASITMTVVGAEYGYAKTVPTGGYPMSSNDDILTNGYTPTAGDTIYICRSFSVTYEQTLHVAVTINGEASETPYFEGDVSYGKEVSFVVPNASFTVTLTVI